jgi:hypothetical protein
MRNITKFLPGVNARRSGLPANSSEFAAGLRLGYRNLQNQSLIGIVNFAPQFFGCVGQRRSPVL